MQQAIHDQSEPAAQIRYAWNILDRCLGVLQLSASNQDLRLSTTRERIQGRPCDDIEYTYVYTTSGELGTARMSLHGEP